MLNSLEIVYCLFCMGLYLLIIYWNQEDSSQNIIMGKKIDELMDDEEPVFIDDLLYEQELFEYQMQKNC